MLSSSGLPFPSPEDLPNPGIEPRSAALQEDPLPSELQGSPTQDTHIEERLADSHSNIFFFFSARQLPSWGTPYL